MIVSFKTHLGPFIFSLSKGGRWTRRPPPSYATAYLWNNNNNNNPPDSVARLYIPRKEGGRGLIAVEVCVNLAKIGLAKYVSESKEKQTDDITSDESWLWLKIGTLKNETEGLLAAQY